jgi:hypothetical protein
MGTPVSTEPTISRPMLNMQNLFEDAARRWVTKNWPEVTQVDFDERTWMHGFTWREEKAGNVTQERASIVYHDGVFWTIDDVRLDQTINPPDYRPEVVYEHTYSAPPGGDLEVKEDWSRTRTIQNTQSIELTQKVSFGSEITTRMSVGIGLDETKIGGEYVAKSTLSFDVGAKESTTRTETNEVGFGQAISFTVPAGKTYKVQYIFDRGEGNFRFTTRARASGWFYIKPKYGPRDPGLHVYPWNIDEKSTLVGTRPMPEEMKSFEFSGVYHNVSYVHGRYAITDETGRQITRQS